MLSDGSQLAVLSSEAEIKDYSEPKEIQYQRNGWKDLAIKLIAFGLAGFFAFVQLSKWPDRLRYPGEEDAAEGTQLSEMVHLRRSIQIYRVPSGGDFDGGIYGPLCYLVGAATINPEHPAYLPLRLLSLGATLLLAVVSGVFVFKLTRNKPAGVLAPFLLLSSAYVGRYGVSARADMVALLLVFSGFVLFYSYRDSRRALTISVTLMLLGFFYKQQFIGAPVAVFLYLVAERRPRKAAEFAAMMFGGGLLLFAVFSFLVFPHQDVFTHFITYNRLPFDKSRILPEILMFAIPLFVPLLASADYLDHFPNKLVACYGGVAAGAYFLLLFSSGSGADTNRCLEAVVVLSCLLAARIVTSHGFISGMAWNGAKGLTLVIVALLGSSLVVPRVTVADFEADRIVQSYLRENFTLGTSALTYYAGDPIRAGLEAPITNLWHYTSLIRKGVISDQAIVSRINRGGYGVVLLDFDLTDSSSTKKADFYTTQSMREAVLHNYQEATRLELPAPELTRYNDKILHVWVPRSSTGRRENR